MAKQRFYTVIHDDDNYVIANKAAGFLTLQDRYQHDLKNLKGMLTHQYGEIFVVHRIDKGTSGIIVFAKNKEAHQHLNLQFENRLVEKSYHAIVNGTFRTKSGTIETLIATDDSMKGRMKVVGSKGKSAISHYEVLEQFQNFALVSVRIETGRTHQVRVHMASIGHSLVGDPMYKGQPTLSIGDLKRRIAGTSERPLISRPALHAASLKFKGIDGQTLEFNCEPPKDIRATIAQLRKCKPLN